MGFCLNTFVNLDRVVLGILELNSCIFPIFESGLCGCVPKPSPSLKRLCCHRCQQWQECHLIRIGWDYGPACPILLTGILDNLGMKGSFY